MEPAWSTDNVIEIGNEVKPATKRGLACDIKRIMENFNLLFPRESKYCTQGFDCAVVDIGKDTCSRGQGGSRNSYNN